MLSIRQQWRVCGRSVGSSNCSPLFLQQQQQHYEQTFCSCLAASAPPNNINKLPVVPCRLGHILCNVLCPRAVLSLTAAATPPTRACIRQLLAIPSDQQVVESPLRDNLRLRVIHCNGATKGGGVNAGVVQLLTTGNRVACTRLLSSCIWTCLIVLLLTG